VLEAFSSEPISHAIKRQVSCRLSRATETANAQVIRDTRRLCRMDERSGQVSDLLHEAGEVHHVVYRITDGSDDDWASFYADWLIDHSELSETLGRVPTRSHLVHELVESERAFNAAERQARWEDFYANRIVDRFG
jgi:hypothetical protein